VKVPDAVNAIVDRRKVSDYLLSAAHPHGRHKAVFFRRFGFRHTEPEVLISALITHVNRHDIAAQSDNAFGTRYNVDGALTCPDERAPVIRSVWFVAVDETMPRFVTAIPLKRKSK
jgi:hypothetical protein